MLGLISFAISICSEGPVLMHSVAKTFAAGIHGKKGHTFCR